MQHVPPMPGGDNDNTATSQGGEHQDENPINSQDEHDKVAVLPNAGSEDLDMSDATKVRDSGLQGTGNSGPSQPAQSSNATQGSDQNDNTENTDTENGFPSVGEPTEPIVFPHVGLDRTRPRFRGLPFRSPDLTSSHTESSQSSNPTQNSTSDSDTTPSEPRYHLDTVDAIFVKSALNKMLPPELTEPVLEYAEYFPSKIIGKRDDEVACSSTEKKLYLTARVPEFPAFDPSTEGAGGSGSKGRPNRVRKLVFKVKSRDQGWSSNAGRGTFVGSYSWLEVELWRRKVAKPESGTEGQSSSDTQTRMTTESVTTEPELSTIQHDETNDHETDHDDENHGYERLGEPELLQRNRHADRNFGEYEIVWDWQKDQLSDSDPEKWEANGEGWYKDGHYQNGAFVRKLRGGDEIRIILASQFPGWACRVASCEVELFWAV